MELEISTYTHGGGGHTHIIPRRVCVRMMGGVKTCTRWGEYHHECVLEYHHDTHTYMVHAEERADAVTIRV